MKSTLVRFNTGTPVYIAAFVSLFVLGLLLTACGSSDPKVSFQSPQDGETIASPVHITMQTENFTVEPAGEVRDGAGHLHVMIDVPCIKSGELIPKDDSHHHFGDGSTEADLDLKPGEHTLCLQAADGVHTALPGEGTRDIVTLLVR